MDAEAMRRAGYATVDAMVSRMAGARAEPVVRRAEPREMRGRLGGGPPEAGADYAAVLERVVRDVLPFTSRTDHPGYFAFVPSFTSWPAALAELIAATANPYCGAWMESAGPTQVELEVIGWFRDWLGLPPGTAGLLVTGGSAANLTALLTAREAAGGPSADSVLYVSDQAHSSLARTARAMGLSAGQVRVLPTDERWRLAPETVAAAVRRDRDSGRVPFALCASAGSTNTGAVDPLGLLADVCAAERLWLHVDAAYGGFAALTGKGRALLAGLDRADSVTLDPHKWLFQPMECGSVLVRDGALLERTFAIHPDYLDDLGARGDGEVNLADRGLQLSRGFRALKVWMSVQTFGTAAFRDAVQHGLDLAELAGSLVREHPQLTLLAPAELGIICFRREWPGCGEAETERRGLELIDALERTGQALVSSTRLAGRHAIRLCVLNPNSTEADVRSVIAHFGDAPEPPPPGARHPGHGTQADGRHEALASQNALASQDAAVQDTALLQTVPLLAGLPDRILAEVRARGVTVDVAAGAEVIRRWDADRSFYVILAGRFEVAIDGRIVRTSGPGDHFGELAARDWGGGYGYARTATVTCAEAGRLLRLSNADFQWLAGQPAVAAELTRILAERLQDR
jgi:aromatic-L-amino-acid decarboxylase